MSEKKRNNKMINDSESKRLSNHRLIFEQLEKRILLSADIGVVLPDADQDLLVDTELSLPDEFIDTVLFEAEAEPSSAELLPVIEAAEQAPADDEATTSETEEETVLPSDGEQLSAELIYAAEQSIALKVKEIVFVDPTVEGYQELLESLFAAEEEQIFETSIEPTYTIPNVDHVADNKQTVEQTADDESVAPLPSSSEEPTNKLRPNVDVYLLNPQGDGVAQITEVLSAYDGLAAVHLISHGSTGTLRIGNSQLSTSTLSKYSERIKAWGKSLASDADILLYGCNVADSETGVAFVKDLSYLTDADVAASDDSTGGEAAGGDWEFEYSTGVIEAEVNAVEDYAHLLKTINGTSAQDDLVGTDSADAINGFGNNDSLTGAKGDDTYTFRDNWGKDTVVELNNEGVDILDFSQVTHDLIFTIKADNKVTVETTDKSHTVTAEFVETLKAGKGENTFIIQKGAKLVDGSIIGNTAAGSTSTVSFTSDVDDPDKLLGSGVSKQVVIDLDNNSLSDKNAAKADKANFLTLTNVDKIIGGRGGDNMTGHITAADHLVGGRGADIIDGQGGADTLEGGQSGDTLKGGAGEDTLLGGGGDDKLLDGGADNDIIEGGDGDDKLVGGSGNDTLKGDDGADSLTGGDNDDTLEGGDGNDSYLFEDGWGKDTISEDADEGKDTLDFSAVTVGLTFGLTSVYDGVADKHYSVYDVAADANNTLKATGNIEKISGGQGANEYVVYASFFENFDPDGLFNKTLVINNDIEAVAEPTAKLDLSHIDTELEIIVAKGEGNGNKVTVIYSTGLLSTKKLVITNVADIVGSSKDDTITFHKGATLVGALNGSAGINTIVYEDTVPTGGEAGTLLAADKAMLETNKGEADEEANLASEKISTAVDATRNDAGFIFSVGEDNYPAVSGKVTNIDSIQTDDNKDTLVGDADTNTLKAEGGDDWLFGQGGADFLEGGSGNDYLDGGVGADTLEGGRGDDVLVGGAGDDTLLYGGWGDDTITGGEGNDTLEGGWGKDTFVFEDGWGQDSIQADKIEKHNDVLDFSAVTEALTYSLYDDGIKVGTGDFNRDSYGVSALSYDKASGTFSTANADTLEVKDPGIGTSHKIGTVKTGIDDQVFYFGNQWRDITIDPSELGVDKKFKLDFSGSTLPLYFTFKEDGSLEIIGYTPGTNEGILSVVGGPLGINATITITDMSKVTEIITGRNSNTYMVEDGANYAGVLTLTGGPQWSQIPLTEKSLPTGISVDHGIDLAGGVAAIAGDFKELSSDLVDMFKSFGDVSFNNGLKDALGQIITKIKDSDVTTIIDMQGMGDSSSPNFSVFDNTMDSIEGIATVDIDDAKIPAKISEVTYGTGINILQGDLGNNKFTHDKGRVGVHMLSGLTGADTYAFSNLFGAAAILEVPDIEFNVDGDPFPLPEALDTLDLSGIISQNVEIDIYHYSVGEGLTQIEYLFGDGGFDDFEDNYTGPDIGTNFLVAQTEVGILVAMDIESIVGPTLGELKLNFHDDATLRGTVRGGILGTVVLDYSDYGSAVNIDMESGFDMALPSIDDIIPGINDALGGFLPDHWVDAVVGEVDAFAFNSATGIEGNILGGLSTIAQSGEALFGGDSVTQLLADFAVYKLEGVIGSPFADTFNGGDRDVTWVAGEGDQILQQASGVSVNKYNDTLDLYGLNDDAAFEVDLTGTQIERNGAAFLTAETIEHVISGQGDDTLTGDSRDNTFTFKIEEGVGWGVDILDGGGGNDSLVFTVDDGTDWAFGDDEEINGETYKVLEFTDEDGVMLADKVKILNDGTSEFDIRTIVNGFFDNAFSGSWYKESKELSLDSLISAELPAGLALGSVDEALIVEALDAFDGKTLQQLDTDGSVLNAAQLSIQEVADADGTVTQVQVVTEDGAVVFDSSTLNIILTDLSGQEVSGRQLNGEIYIDKTAADFGWHLDASSDPSADQVDLISVLSYELLKALNIDLSSISAPDVGTARLTLTNTISMTTDAFDGAALEVSSLPANALLAIDASVTALMSEAVSRWQAKADAGEITIIGSSDTPTITSPSLVLQDLAGDEIARTLEDGTIVLDPTAAGHGWFVDATPDTSDDVPSNQIDLLSVLMHEVGHANGLGHDAAAGTDVMDETITPGTRFDLPSGSFDVLTLDSSDQSKLSEGLGAFSGWVEDVGDDIDGILNTEITIPFIDSSLADLFGLSGDAASQLTAGLSADIIDQVQSIFDPTHANYDPDGDGKLTNLDIDQLDNISFAPSSNDVAYIATVGLPGLDFDEHYDFDLASLSIAGIDPADLGISMDGDIELNVSGGLDLEFLFGLDSAGEFYVEAPSVVASLAIDSGADPFDVGISLGPFGLSVEQGSIDLDAEMRLGTSERLGYDQLVSNTTPSAMLPSLTANYDIDLPLTLTGGLSGVSSTDLEITAEGSFGPGIGSLQSLFANMEFDVPNIGDLLGLRGVSLDTILDGIISGLDYLVADDSVIYEKLPGINQSAVELLGDGTDDFLTQIKDAVESVRGGNLNSLETELNNALNVILGTGVDPFALVYEDSTFLIDFAFETLLDSTEVNFQVDLEDYLSQLPLPDIVMDQLDNLDIAIGDENGNIGIGVEGFAGVNFGFGFDLNDVMNPINYLTSGSGVYLGIQAETINPIDLDVNFALGLAGMEEVGFLIDDATAEIRLQADFALADNSEGRYELDTITGGDVVATIEGYANLDLPLYLSEGYAVGGTTEDLNGDGYDDNIIHLGAELEDGSIDWEAIGPGMDQLFELAALLNDPAQLLEGLETMFEYLEDNMDDRFDSLQLPFIDNSLSDSSSFITNIRDALLGAKDGDTYSDNRLGQKLQEAAANGDSVIDLVRVELYNALSNFEFDGEFMNLLQVAVLDDGGNITYDENGDIIWKPVENSDELGLTITEDAIQFDFVIAGEIFPTKEVPLSFDGSIPGLGLKSNSDSAILIDFDYTMGLGFGLSAGDGVYVNTEGVTDSGAEVALDLDVALAEGSGLEATLGFLTLTLDEAVDDDGLSGLFGDFEIDIYDANNRDGRWSLFGDTLGMEARLSAVANADLDGAIVVDAGDISLPEITTTIHYDQIFAEATLGANGSQFSLMNSPEVVFEAVTLDLGSAISGFVGPIAEEIGGYIGPDSLIRKVIDILTTPIDIGITEFQLLDLARLKMSTTDVAKLEKAVDAIIAFSDFIGLVGDASGEDGVLINFGDFEVGGGLLGDKDAEVSDDDVAGKTTQDLAGQTTGKTKELAEKLGNTDPGSIQFPLLSDPMSVLGLLMGRDVDLFIYDMPDLSFNAGYRQSFMVFPGLNASIGGEIWAETDLSFGFDTTGISEWAYEENFDIGEMGLIFNGFFFSDWADPTDSSTEKDEILIGAQLYAGASLGIGGLVEAGVEGGVEVEVGLDLNDMPNDGTGGNTGIEAVYDGKMRINELIERLDHGVECLFDAHGEVSAFLEAFLWTGFKVFGAEITLFEARERFVDVVLAEFNFSCPEGPDPTVATYSNGVLTLAYDPDGSDAPGDQAEEYKVKLTEIDITPSDGADNPVERIAVTGNGHTQYFDPTLVNKIVANGTDFDDIYKFSSGIDADIEIHGGDGADYISIASDAINRTRLIYGDEGEDTIIGSELADEIHGGSGSDTISAGSGGDTVYGDAGNDYIEAGNSEGSDRNVVDGGADSDTIIGGDGIDEIYGGDGDDRLYGEGGSDYLYGQAGVDSLLGGSGIDTLQGGDDNDYLAGNTGADLLYGDTGADTFDWYAGDGADTIYGANESASGFANDSSQDRLKMQSFTRDNRGIVTDPATDDVVMVAASGVDVALDWNGELLNLDGIGALDLDTGDGADTLTFGSLAATTLTNVSASLGSERSIVEEERQVRDQYGVLVDGEYDTFNIINKDIDSKQDAIEIVGKTTTDQFTINSTVETDPETGEGADVVRVEQSGGVTFNIKEVSSLHDKIVVDSAQGDDTIDATGLTKDLVHDLRMIGSEGDDTLIGSDYAETLIGGAGADRITGGLSVDLFVHDEHTEEAREYVADELRIDTLVEERNADFTISNNMVEIGGEVETLNEVFEAVEFVGGDNANRFALENWSGNGYIDGGDGSDIYEVTLAQSADGASFININDSGTDGRDILSYSGSSEMDLIQLDTVYRQTQDPDRIFSSDRWVEYGDHGDGLLIAHFGAALAGYGKKDIDDTEALFEVGVSSLVASESYQALNYSTVEDVTVYGGTGNDVFVSDDTAATLNVYGNEGDDQFYVGSILETEDVLVEGQEITVAIEVTQGASYEMNFYGGDDDDYFEVNHNAADINLYGDNGDDTFFIKALLTLDEDGNTFDLVGETANVNAGKEVQDETDTREVDVDSLVYVENANVNIDGGAGFDSVAVVGTALSDTFYVWAEESNGEVIQRIFGAGIKLSQLVNIERLVLLTGSGDDRIYVNGVDLGPNADMVLNLGSGSDEVFVGGNTINFDANYPKQNNIEYATLNGYEQGEAYTTWGRTVYDVATSELIVPYTIRLPAQTEEMVLPGLREISEFKSPLTIIGGVGEIDRLTVNNQDGPESIEFSDTLLVKKQIETDDTVVVFPELSAVMAGNVTDLLNQAMADEPQVREMVADFLRNHILFQDKYVDTGLIDDLQGLLASESMLLDLPEGISYAVFQDTLIDVVSDNDPKETVKEVSTARDQLAEFLEGTGYEASYEAYTVPGSEGLEIFYQLTEIVNADGHKLMFETQNKTIMVDDVERHNMIGVSLITASESQFKVGAGYIETVEVIDEDALNTLSVQGLPSNIFFEGFDEFNLNLNENTENKLLLDNALFQGVTTVHGGEQNDEFTVHATAGQALLHGNMGDDHYSIGDGTVDEITAELFLLGGDGQDSIVVNSEILDGDADVSLDKNYLEHQYAQEKLNKISSLLGLDGDGTITDSENELVLEKLHQQTADYIDLIGEAEFDQFMQVVGMAGQNYAPELVSLFETAKQNFDADITQLMSDTKDVYLAGIEQQISEYQTLIERLSTLASVEAYRLMIEGLEVDLTAAIVEKDASITGLNASLLAEYGADYTNDIKNDFEILLTDYAADDIALADLLADGDLLDQLRQAKIDAFNSGIEILVDDYKSAADAITARLTEFVDEGSSFTEIVASLEYDLTTLNNGGQAVDDHVDTLGSDLTGNNRNALYLQLDLYLADSDGSVTANSLLSFVQDATAGMDAADKQAYEYQLVSLAETYKTAHDIVVALEQKYSPVGESLSLSEIIANLNNDIAAVEQAMQDAEDALADGLDAIFGAPYVDVVGSGFDTILPDFIAGAITISDLLATLDAAYSAQSADYKAALTSLLEAFKVQADVVTRFQLLLDKDDLTLDQVQADLAVAISVSDTELVQYLETVEAHKVAQADTESHLDEQTTVVESAKQGLDQFIMEQLSVATLSAAYDAAVVQDDKSATDLVTDILAVLEAEHDAAFTSLDESGGRENFEAALFGMVSAYTTDRDALLALQEELDAYVAVSSDVGDLIGTVAAAKDVIADDLLNDSGIDVDDFLQVNDHELSEIAEDLLAGEIDANESQQERVDLLDDYLGNTDVGGVNAEINTVADPVVQRLEAVIAALELFADSDFSISEVASVDAAIQAFTDEIDGINEGESADKDLVKVLATALLPALSLDDVFDQLDAMQDVLNYQAANPDIFSITAEFAGISSFASAQELYEGAGSDTESDEKLIDLILAYQQVESLAGEYGLGKAQELTDFRSTLEALERLRVYASYLPSEGLLDIQELFENYNSNLSEYDEIANADTRIDAIKDKAVAEAKLASLEKDEVAVDLVVENNLVFDTYYATLISYFPWAASWISDFFSESKTITDGARVDQSALKTEIGLLNTQLDTADTLLADTDQRLAELDDELADQYQMIKVLGPAVLEVLSGTETEEGTRTGNELMALLEADSSLIASIQSYRNDYAVVAEHGDDVIGVPVFDGASFSTVTSTVESIDYTALLSLTGLNEFGIHADYEQVESLTLNLGDGNDLITIGDSLGQADSLVQVNTAAGDDEIHVGNESNTVDDVVGTLKIDASSGSNMLVIDDSGDQTGDVITQQYGADDYIQLSGMADGDVFYKSSGGFSNGLSVTTSAGDDEVSISALHGSDYTELFTIEGDDEITVNSFAVDPNAELTIYSGSGDDDVDAFNAPLGVTIYAESDNDVVLGSQYADLISGGFGDDWLSGSTGNDVIWGDLANTHTDTAGDGDDIIFGNSGDDTLYGQGGSDILFGDNGLVTQTLVASTDGAVGVDTIDTGSGDDIAMGGLGNDTITGVGGNNIVIGDEGKVVYSILAALTLIRNDESTEGGNDIITIAGGDNRILGGTGDDDITTGAGTDVVLSDHGQLTYSEGKAVSFEAYPQAGCGSDVISTGGGDDYILAGSGDDDILAGDGNDFVIGGNGQMLFDENGIIESIANNDATDACGTTSDNDIISLGDGDNVALAGDGNDDVTTGDGDNIVIADKGVVNFSNGLPVYIEAMFSSGGNDSVTFGHGQNLAMGGAGSDLLNGGLGEDILLGDYGIAQKEKSGYTKVWTTYPSTGGNDRLYGHGGDDILLGSAGRDSIWGGDNSDIVFGDGGVIELDSGKPFHFKNIDIFIGDDDFLSGGSGNDYIFGGAGHDTLDGNLEEDVLAGDIAEVTISPTGVVNVFAPEFGNLDLTNTTLDDLYTTYSVAPDLLDIEGLMPSPKPVSEVAPIEQVGINANANSHAAQSRATSMLAMASGSAAEAEVLQSMLSMLAATDVKVQGNADLNWPNNLPATATGPTIHAVADVKTQDNTDLEWLNNLPATAAGPTTHGVVIGDTLWDIAARYLGDPTSWPELLKLNPWIENPDFIAPGQDIQLPAAANDANDATEKAEIKDDAVDPQAQQNELLPLVEGVAFAAMTGFGSHRANRANGLYVLDGNGGDLKPSYSGSGKSMSVDDKTNVCIDWDS